MKNIQGKSPKNLIKNGDLFQLGDNHFLLCADSTDPKAVKALVANSEINIILTDPPYGVAYTEGKEFMSQSRDHKRIVNDQQQTEQEYINFSRAWIGAVKPFMADKNSIYIFNSDKMIFALREAMKLEKLYFSQLLIWIKSQAIVGRLDYLPQHEIIAYSWIGTHRFMKSKDKSLLFCPKPSKSKLHPTMKPISLLRRLILNSSEIGDTVFDGFAGSGSTIMACEQTKRKCLAIEVDPDYCQVILDRFEATFKRTPKFTKNIYHD